MASSTSSRTAWPKRRRTSSRSSACRRSSASSSSTSRSTLRVTRNRSEPSDRHAGEQQRQVGRDELLERHPCGGRHGDEPAHVRRHLDPSEPLAAGSGVAHAYGQVQRQTADVGEGVGRVDGERGEDREHLLAEVALQACMFPLAEVVPPHQADALLGQPGQYLVAQARALAGHERARSLADGPQLLAEGQTVDRAERQPGRLPAFEPGDAHHEELVQIAREDRQELGTFQQRRLRVFGEGEHAGVEVQPGRLPVEETPFRQVQLRRELLGEVKRFQQPAAGLAQEAAPGRGPVLPHLRHG